MVFIAAGLWVRKPVNNSKIKHFLEFLKIKNLYYALIKIGNPLIYAKIKAQQNCQCTRVRRKRRCHYKQMPGPKILLKYKIIIAIMQRMGHTIPDEYTSNRCRQLNGTFPFTVCILCVLNSNLSFGVGHKPGGIF